ncbi:MAG: peptidase E [Bacteroidota bacterium]
MIKRQIIAMGGGGFSMEPENPLLDEYVLAQCAKETPAICFIGTASGDAERYIENFYNAFRPKNCKPSHLSLFKGHTDKIEEFVMEQDIFYVGGGNTRNLLVLWKEWGLDKMLRRAYEKGTVMAGISAGSICWFEHGLTDSVPKQLNKLECLGFLKGSNTPHFDGEAERQESYRSKVRSGEMLPGIACDDSVALHFIDEELHAVICSVEGKAAYRMQLEAGQLQEERLEPLYLGNS